MNSVPPALDESLFKEEDAQRYPEWDDIMREGIDIMSSQTPTSDWIELRLSRLDNKIDMHRKDWEAAVKDMNHKFDAMMADSNAKFDRLFAKLESDSEIKELRIEASHQKVETSIANAKLQIVMWVIATALAAGSIAYKIWPPHNPDHPAVLASVPAKADTVTPPATIAKPTTAPTQPKLKSAP